MALSHASTDSIESALLTLLARHPDALVLAVRGEGTPRRVPVPASIPLGAHDRVDVERNLMDEVVPADRAVVAKLWGQARTQGAAMAPVRLVSDPETPSNLYFLDVRKQHQVMMVLFTPGRCAPDEDVVDAARLDHAAATGGPCHQGHELRVHVGRPGAVGDPRLANRRDRRSPHARVRSSRRP